MSTQECLIIPCSKVKRPYSAPARDMYQGRKVQMLLRRIDHSKYDVFIMSGLLGFLSLNTIVEPYEISLNERIWQAGESIKHTEEARAHRKVRKQNMRNLEVTIRRQETMISGYSTINCMLGENYRFVLQRAFKCNPIRDRINFIPAFHSGGSGRIRDGILALPFFKPQEIIQPELEFE